jgi:hypothetical protein
LIAAPWDGQTPWASRAIRPRTLPLGWVVGLAFACWTLAPAQARDLRDATRLGAFSGAMRYCEERFGGNERRYRMARLRVAGEVDVMERREKIRALAARDRAYERGEFLGSPLDRRGCTSLLRGSEWRAWVD